MPRYTYICQNCNEKYVITHPVGQRIAKNAECKVCGVAAIAKALDVPMKMKESQLPAGHKAGSLVKSTIADAKEDLRREREGGRVFDPNSNR